jgi:hypothetical protein
MSQPVIKLDESTPDRPRLVVEVPAEQRGAIQAALDALTEAGDGAMIQRIVAEALLTAIEQRYFWTPEWQIKEQEADDEPGSGRPGNLKRET